MKQSTAKRQTKARLAEQEQLLTEDFRWMGEVHKVLSPFWSARTGYQAPRIDAGSPKTETLQ